jgi:hypothetical protein
MICRCCLEPNKEDLLTGIVDITNLNQLYEIIVNPALREVHITTNFAEKFFTPAGLMEFMSSAMQMNEFVQVYVDDKYLARETELLRLIGTITCTDDLISLCLNNRTIMKQTVLDMYESVMTTYTTELAYSNKLNSVNLQLMEQMQKTKLADTDLHHLRNNYSSLKSKYDILTARIKYQYNIPLDLNWLEVESDNCMFKRILYIKEITRVKYVDTFIYYLNETLASLYNEPARNIVIEPNGAYMRSYMYPGYRRSNELSLRDVVSANIFMNGFQSNLMKDILKNRETVNYLIILDRGGWHKNHVTGEKVETIYTVSDLKDLNVEVGKRHVITYSADTLYIPNVQGFDRLGSEEKMTKYSSMMIMRSVLEMLELGK